MRKIAILGTLVLLCLLIGMVSAQQLAISNVTNIQKNAIADMNVTIQHSTKNIAIIDLTFTYNPAVISVNSFIANSSLCSVWAYSIDNDAGVSGVTLQPFDPFNGINAKNPLKVMSVNVKSLKDDGSWTWNNITPNEITENTSSQDITSEFYGHISNGFLST